MVKKSKRDLEEYVREDDGVHYIAISSKGRSKLGRLLAAGAYLPVNVPQYGTFSSLAAFIRFVNGDRREHVRTECGVDMDEALNESVPDSYHDLLQSYVGQMIHTPRAVELDLPNLLWANHLPFAVYQYVDGEMIPMELPPWFEEIIQRTRKLGAPPPPPTVQAPVVPTKPRSLVELQRAYLDLVESTNEPVEFTVTQEEFDNLPYGVRKVMGDVLKVQAVFEGRDIKPPTRE